MDEAALVDDVRFDGTWREYAAIALPNLLLTLASLGLYRYWARACVRRYLWSRTILMGDRLEWTGTGFEMFRGAAGVLVLVLLPLALANIAIRQLLLHGHPVAARVASGILLAVFYTLVGAAVLRGLRYRLSRTRWRGIGGGSDNTGWHYGLSYLWKNAAAMATLGIALPWAMTSLWNQRWRTMHFGSWRFASTVRARGLAAPFLLCYLAPIAAGGVVWLLLRSGMVVTWFGIEPRTPLQWILIRLPALFAFLFVFTLIITGFYASFFRQALGSLSIDGVDFAFNAGAVEWMELLVGDVLLVGLTLGLGLAFLPYRHWLFRIRYLQLAGRTDPATLHRSTTAAPTQGEGLLEALGMGAL